MAQETRRSPLSVGKVESELKAINPYQLGIHLDVPPEDLERFEQEHPRDVTRQRIEVIKYWLRNIVNATWSTLATAVEKIGGHHLLVTRLRELARQDSHGDPVDESDFQTPPESPRDLNARKEQDIFDHISALPSLKMGSSVDSDETLLASATTKLKLEFSTLFTKVRLSLQKLQVSAESVLSHLKSIEAFGPHFEVVYMSQSETFSGTVSKHFQSLEDLFPAIAPYCSWFNHLLVENIIDTFCDEDDKLQQNWESFKEKFVKYCEARLHKCPQDQFGEDHSQIGTTRVVMKIDFQWKTVKVKQLAVIRDVVSQVLQIKPYNLYLRAVQNGCVELLFYVPFSKVIRFVQPSVEQIAGLQQNGVVKIQFDTSVKLAATIGDEIDKMIHDQESRMTVPVPGFSNLLDIAQYLSESALDVYEQYIKSSASHQFQHIGDHLKQLGDEFQIRLRIAPVAQRFRSLGDQFQARLFSPIYFAQLLPVLCAFLMYDFLPHSLSSVILGISLAGSGFLFLRRWRKDHFRGPTVPAHV